MWLVVSVSMGEYGRCVCASIYKALLHSLDDGEITNTAQCVSHDATPPGLPDITETTRHTESVPLNKPVSVTRATRLRFVSGQNDMETFQESTENEIQKWA